MALIFVQTDAFLGSRRLNPFNLQHFGLTSLEFSTNSEVIHTVRTNFSETGSGDFASAYHDLYKGNFGHTPKVSPNISMFEFKYGYFIVMLEIKQPMHLFHQSDVWARQPVGSLTVSGRFDKALKRSVEVIVMGTFYDNLFLTKARACYLASQKFRDSKAAIS